MALDQELLRVILSITEPDELNQFLKEIFTPAELDDISLRWKLLRDLHKGVPQRKIAEKYGISLCKITRGSKVLKNEKSVVLKTLNR